MSSLYIKKSIKKSMTEYHHLINSQAYLLFYYISLRGEMRYDKIWSLVFFHSFGALNGVFEVQFYQGFIFFYTLSKTLIACRTMQLRFLKVETLLNNAFKGSRPMTHLHNIVGVLKRNKTIVT